MARKVKTKAKVQVSQPDSVKAGQNKSKNIGGILNAKVVSSVEKVRKTKTVKKDSI